MSNIYTAIETQPCVADSSHTWIIDGSHAQHIHPSYIRGYRQNLKEKTEKEFDTYPVDNPLNAEDTRILFKILHKHYADAGRKRGAILRYIKSYRELKPDPIGTRLYNQLNNNET